MTFKRGTLSNKETGQTLTGRVDIWPNSTQFTAWIDGTNQSNTFTTEDWDFEAEAPKLPTKLGTVIGYRPGYSYYMLTKNGWVNAASAITYQPKDMLPGWEVLLDAQG